MRSKPTRYDQHQLGRGRIDTDDARPASSEPGRQIGGTAAQLQYVEDRQMVGKHLKLRLANVPDTPVDLRLPPRSARSCIRVAGVPLGPHAAIDGYGLLQLELQTRCSIHGFNSAPSRFLRAGAQQTAPMAMEFRGCIRAIGRLIEVLTSRQFHPSLPRVRCDDRFWRSTMG